MAFVLDRKTDGIKMSTLTLLQHRQLGTAMNPNFAYQSPSMASQTHLSKYICGSRHFVERLKLIQRLKEKGHHGCVNSINFSHSGQLLASGSDDLKIVLWDWQRGVARTTMETDHVANIFQAKFLPGTEDLHLVSAARDGQVMHNILSPSGSVVYKKRVARHRDSAHKLALESDSPHLLLSCGEDGAVFEIDLREEKPKSLLVCRSSQGRVPLYSIFIDPSDNNSFAISGMDQFARIFDRRNIVINNKCPEPVKRFCPDHLKEPQNDSVKANITCLVYSHDGKELLCSYNDEDIYLFDATHSSESEAIKRYKGHRNNQTVKGVNFFGSQSEYIVSGSDCGHVFLWDKESEELAQCLKGDFNGVVNCLEPHPTTPVLAVSGLDHDPKIFAPISHKPTLCEDITEVTEANSKGRDQDWRMVSGDPFGRLIRRMFLRRFRNSFQRGEEMEGDDSSDSEEDGGMEENNELDLFLPVQFGFHQLLDDEDDDDEDQDDSFDDDNDNDDNDNDDNDRGDGDGDGGRSGGGSRRGRRLRHVNCSQQ